MRRSFAAMISGLLAIGLVTASCSVPTDETAQEIDPEELPEVLRPTSTTTTSSLPPPSSESQTVFLLTSQEDRDTVVPVERQVAAGSDPEATLATLFGSGLTVVTGPEQEENLFNALDEFSLNDVAIENGIATIDISHIDAFTGEPDDVPIGTLLLNVAAQLVFSATEHEGIDSVLIERDGEPLSLPTQTEGGDSDQPVDRDSYQRYDATIPLDDANSSTTSSSTSSTTTTATTTSTTTTTTAAPA